MNSVSCRESSKLATVLNNRCIEIRIVPKSYIDTDFLAGDGPSNNIINSLSLCSNLVSPYWEANGELSGPRTFGFSKEPTKLE